MKRKKGLTLIELSLTITLASMLMTSIFFLANNQRKTLKRLQINTSALYMLESMRNFARFQIKSGVSFASITSKDLTSFVNSSDNWAVVVKFSSEPGFEKILISLAYIEKGNPECVYTTEVTTE